ERRKRYRIFPVLLHALRRPRERVAEEQRLEARAEKLAGLRQQPRDDEEPLVTQGGGKVPNRGGQGSQPTGFLRIQPQSRPDAFRVGAKLLPQSGLGKQAGEQPLRLL